MRVGARSPRRSGLADVPLGASGEPLWWRAVRRPAEPQVGCCGGDCSCQDRAGSERRSDQDLPELLESLVSRVVGLATECPTWSLPEPQVGAAIGQAHRLHESAQALVAVLCREAGERGLGVADGLSQPDWIGTQAPGLQGPAAARLALVGGALREQRWAALGDKVAAGSTSVEHAAAIIRFERDVAPVADPDHLEAIVDAMVDNVEALTVKELARLIAHARASIKPPAALDDEDARRRLGRAFTKVGKSAGMTEYRLRLDPEGAAIMDAAIDPLARPRPDLAWDGTEKQDPRTHSTRCADALLELVVRAVASPDGVARTERTKLVVTMSADALLDGIRGAGLADNDEILSPGTIRRLACDAGVIPVVLGSPSEVLDVGREQRFFTQAQRRALTIRDKGCTFPGCTMPPQWCEAHHVSHWIDGGATDLDNAALLCGRHHTVVHVRSLTATVTGRGVTWHV